LREFEDDAETINIRFASDPFVNDSLTPTNPIAIRTDEPDSNYLVWSVGASAQFTQGVAAFVNYRGFIAHRRRRPRRTHRRDAHGTVILTRMNAPMSA